MSEHKGVKNLKYAQLLQEVAKYKTKSNADNTEIAARNAKIRQLEISNKALRALRAKAVARQATNERIGANRGRNDLKNRLAFGWQLTEFHPKRAYFDGTARKILDNTVKYKNLKNEEKRKSYLNSLDATNREMIEKYVRQGLSDKFLKKIRNDLTKNCSKYGAQQGGYKEKMGCKWTNSAARPPNVGTTFSASTVPPNSAWSARREKPGNARRTNGSQRNARGNTGTPNSNQRTNNNGFERVSSKKGKKQGSAKK
jgi:hypothetical protein